MVDVIEHDHPHPSGRRGPAALVALAVPLLLLALGGWYFQDAVATRVNVGEADMGETVVFTSHGGRYRLLSSGPLRPEVEQTYCDLTLADGTERTEVGGQGLQTTRLGVDRLLAFRAPAGETEVTCSYRGNGGGQGRFQVIEADGPLRFVLGGLAGAAVLSLLAGILWGWLGRRGN